MSATLNFYSDTPAGTARLIGICAVNADGTLASTSKYSDGTPVFTSVKNATGTYTVTLGHPEVAPVLSALPTGAGGARMIKVFKGVNLFGVQTFNDAGVLIDAAFDLSYYEI